MAESEPERAFAVNRDGAGRLAATARFFRVPFVHVSTDYVFDGCKASTYCESDDPCPLGAYGQSKLEGENAVMSENPDAIVFRTSWVYSPYGTNFLKTMLRLAETRDVVRVIDDQHGAPTAAIDLAGAIVDALMQVLERGARGRAGVYHVTASGETTWYGFAKAIFAGWRDRGHRIPQLEAITTADYPTRVKRPANSRLDCQKVQRVFRHLFAAVVNLLGTLPGRLSQMRGGKYDYEGHHSCRRKWNATLSNNSRYQQTVVADLRQANDLLSAIDADARRNSRHPCYHDAG